jgi:hypothetical protein
MTDPFRRFAGVLFHLILKGSQFKHQGDENNPDYDCEGTIDRALPPVVIHEANAVERCNTEPDNHQPNDDKYGSV